MAGKSGQESFVNMFTRLGKELRLPEVDIDRIVEHNRKNLEALEKSSRAATTGASTIAARQREIFEQTLKDISELAHDTSIPATPQELMARQTAFARKSFETAMRNSTEMADLMRRSSQETIDILRERIREGMQEIRDSYDKRD